MLTIFLVSANILLDESYTAKLGDFGLAREGPSSSVSMSYFLLGDEHTPGTIGYLAKEYMDDKKLSVQVKKRTFFNCFANFINFNVLFALKFYLSIVVMVSWFILGWYICVWSCITWALHRKACLWSQP